MKNTDTKKHTKNKNVKTITKDREQRKNKENQSGGNFIQMKSVSVNGKREEYEFNYTANSISKT